MTEAWEPGTAPKFPQLSRQPLSMAVVGVSRVHVSAWKCFNGNEPGWYFQVGNLGTWVTDKDADALARMILFEGDEGD